MGKTFFVINAHSKWIDAVCSNSSSATAAIEHLYRIFFLAVCSIPEIIVSKDAAGEEFLSFITSTSNGINHIILAPHHRSSNGLAEHVAQIVKNNLRKLTEGTINSRLAKILFAHRITLQSTTRTSPSELMLNRLDLAKPNICQRVEINQLFQKIYHDTNGKVKSFIINNPLRT